MPESSDTSGILTKDVALELMRDEMSKATGLDLVVWKQLIRMTEDDRLEVRLDSKDELCFRLREAV